MVKTLSLLYRGDAFVLARFHVPLTSTQVLLRFNFQTMDKPRSVPSVAYQLPRSTSYGCASGTKAKDTNPCHLSGLRGSRTMMKSHSGMWAGYHLNPKSLNKSSILTVATAHGRILKCWRRTSIRDGPSPWTPRPQPTTNAARSGSLAFARTQ